MFWKFLNYIDIQTIIYYVDSKDNKKIKRGLQYLCNALENEGKNISQEHLNIISKNLAKLMFSENNQVRRWLYKSIALLKVDVYIPYLLGQLINETDEENQTWVCAAIFSIQSFENALETFSKSGLEFYNTRYQLAACYLKKNLVYLLNEHQIIKLLDTDYLACKWVSLLFGKAYHFLQKNIVIDFNRHHNQEIVEYSIWALHQSKAGSIKDLLILPQDINKFEANVRRWYYRLLTKNQKNIYPYFDLIENAIKREEEFSVREGLAQGLLNTYLDDKFSESIVEWYYFEINDLVKLQLLNHFLNFAKKNKLYKQTLDSILNSTKDEYIYHLISAKLGLYNSSKTIFNTFNVINKSLKTPSYTSSVNSDSQPYFSNKVEDEIAIYRRNAEEMKEFATLALMALRERPINVDVRVVSESKAMSESTDQSRKIEIGSITGDFNASGQALNLGEIDISGQVANTVNQIPDESESANQPGIKELLIQLKNAIENAAELSTGEKTLLLEQVKALAEATQASEPEKKKNIVQKVHDIFATILKSLPDTAKIVESAGKLLPMIMKALGLDP
jgi:hypothetical protein